MTESATEFGVSLFDEFKEDYFFAPAFKSFSWVELVTNGSVFGGGSSSPVTYSGTCLEVMGGTKTQKIQMIGGLQATDIYIKGKLVEIKKPPLNQIVTFNGKTYTVVYSNQDSVEVLFELFLRA